MEWVLSGWSSSGFMPHGQCYLWTPGLLWLHVSSDALIGLAYIVIPIALIQVIRQRDDLPFSWMFALFGVFIVACGATHFVEIWNVWHAHYWFSGGVKLITAAASIPTAILLIKLLPRIRAIPSQNEFALANRRLEGAMQELEQFSYAVSHDLRAPLRGMEGFSRALQKDYADKLDEQGEHYLKRIQEGSRKMGELIDDLLALSRVQRDETTDEPVDLSVMAAEIADELRKTDPERDVEMEIAPGLTARGDPKLLRIALQNLISNAWKFTRDRSAARIEVGRTRTESGPAFFVSDNGAGFDMQHAGKLFVPFQRLHSDADFPGHGIGLATVQRVMHKHGGRVWAEGREGEGSTFYFTTA
jgi:signal transduction histidine kinase